MVNRREIVLSSFVDGYDDVRHLFLANWRESGANADIPLDVDVEKYAAADRAGILRCFMAKLDGKPVGYAVFILSRHSQYQRTIYAICDVIYIDPPARTSMIGLDLIRATEAALAAEGVDIIQQAEPGGDTALGKLLRYLGYAPKEIIWTKRIGHIHEAAQAA